MEENHYSTTIKANGNPELPVSIMIGHDLILDMLIIIVKDEEDQYREAIWITQPAADISYELKDHTDPDNPIDDEGFLDYHELEEKFDLAYLKKMPHYGIYQALKRFLTDIEHPIASKL